MDLEVRSPVLQTGDFQRFSGATKNSGGGYGVERPAGCRCSNWWLEEGTGHSASAAIPRPMEVEVIPPKR